MELTGTERKMPKGETEKDNSGIREKRRLSKEERERERERERPNSIPYPKIAKLEGRKVDARNRESEKKREKGFIAIFPLSL